MKKVFTILLVVSVTRLSFLGCNRDIKDKDSFSIAFMTDIHIQPEENAVAGFTQALDSVNKLNPDFILTGGDLIMDALGQSYGRADSLYNLYMEVIKNQMNRFTIQWVIMRFMAFIKEAVLIRQIQNMESSCLKRDLENLTMFLNIKVGNS